MRKALAFLFAALFATAALSQAVSISVKKSAVAGVRVTNPNWEPTIPGPLEFPPTWNDGAGNEPPTSYTLQKSVAFSLNLAQLCSVDAGAPVGVLSFSKVAGSYPTGINLAGSVLSGTPTVVQSQAITLRCTFTPDAGAATTDDWAVTLDVIDPDSATPTAPGNFACPAASTTSITCSWVASTDASGIRNYYVSSSGDEATCNAADNNVVTVASPTLTYTRTGLAASTTYWFKIKVDDNSASHNATAYSACISGTTAAETPPPPPPSGTQLILDDGLENGVPTSIYNPALRDGTGTLAVETTHAREGTNSLHTSLAKSGTTNFRQEYRVRTAHDNDPSAGSPMYWLGFSLYIDPATVILSQSVIFQFHTVTSNSGASPVISIRMINDRWQFTSDSLADELFGPTITKGVWHDIVFQILWRTTNTGMCKIWIDGVLYINKVNMRTTWAGENNIPWIHMGSYSSAWKLAGNPDPAGTVHSQWHDALRIALDDNAVYADVAPRGDRTAAP